MKLSKYSGIYCKLKSYLRIRIYFIWYLWHSNLVPFLYRLITGSCNGHVTSSINLSQALISRNGITDHIELLPVSLNLKVIFNIDDYIMLKYQIKTQTDKPLSIKSLWLPGVTMFLHWCLCCHHHQPATDFCSDDNFRTTLHISFFQDWWPWSIDCLIRFLFD